MSRTKKNQNNFKESALHFIDSYFQEVIKCIVLLDKQPIERMIELIMETYRNDRKIYVLGNGGGASTASHMACDLGKGTLNRVYDQKEKRLHVLSLTDNVAIMTAYANDLSYDDIFIQQLRNLVERDDVVIAISGSGNTKNILNAVSYAKKVGAKTIGLTGFNTGGKLAQMVDVSIIVKTSHYGPLEDVHMMIGHLVSAAVASAKHAESASGKARKNKAVPFYLE
ncbi:MAG: SIS domain-containing protein [Candidatus Levybacteria bacterium]|nr:SIS domain-containing protein [Candidatus Levybacteria bacterium]